MADPLITLTTDFGEESPYAAAMKGVILTINPCARLVDLTHRIPPQDLRHAGFFLRHSIPFFPQGTIHVVVVDPGVGSARALLYVEVAGQRLLVPDNGCWTRLLELAAEPARVQRLDDARFWKAPVSNTFHGRDILAPVAGHLSLGLDPTRLGPAVSDWARLSWPTPQRSATQLLGEVLVIDHFGNLITNIPGDWLPPASSAVRIVVGNHEVSRLCRAYAEARGGELIALRSSAGFLEIAVSHGNAAAQLQLGTGTPVRVDWTAPRRE